MWIEINRTTDSGRSSSSVIQLGGAGNSEPQPHAAKFGTRQDPSNGSIWTRNQGRAVGGVFNVWTHINRYMMIYGYLYISCRQNDPCPCGVGSHQFNPYQWVAGLVALRPATKNCIKNVDWNIPKQQHKNMTPQFLGGFIQRTQDREQHGSPAKPNKPFLGQFMMPNLLRHQALSFGRQWPS